ncbi:MAG: hypothetical protein HPY44_19630 [Armatimonadetes bacterium]|nr:hypothetical protein [Armatimonadota bacterium]
MPRKRVSFSKRQLKAYALCALIFGFTMLLALRLSYPPDPMAGRYPRTPASRDSVETENNQLRIRADGRYEVYRFVETDRGIAAERVDEGRE